MRRPTIYKRSSIGFNMTPMIDVVFQLIIFFLLSSHLVKQESQMALPLPLASSGPQAVDDESSPRLTINVLADGGMLLAGRQVTREQLASHLREALERSGKDLEVRIRSDRSVPYRNVEPILLSCARGGIWNVTFAVYRPEDAPK